MELANQYANRYEGAISWIVSRCPYPDKFAHTYAGLALWLIAAITFKRPLGSFIPFAAILVIEIANECVDRIAHGAWMWRDTLGDMAATWFWPTALMLAFRCFPEIRP